MAKGKYAKKSSRPRKIYKKILWATAIIRLITAIIQFFKSTFLK